MNPESVSVYVKEDQLHQNLDASSGEQNFPQMRVTTQSNIFAHMRVPNCQSKRKPSTKKCRVSSFFCFVSLLVTTSVVFMHLLFYTGLTVSYSPIICNSSYDFNVEDETERKLKQKERNTPCSSSYGRNYIPEALSTNADVKILLQLLSENGPQQRLPQCIIIGVRKCGTKALIEFMNLHPMIQIATQEISFFDHDDNYTLGLDWYRSRMPYSFPEQITVEKTPGYFNTPSVPARIHNMDPDIKLLLIVREPVTRLISEYAHRASKLAENGTLLAPFEDLALGPNGTVNTDYIAVMVGMYSLYFPMWISTFPRKQIHIVDGDNLILDPFSEIQKIENFLGLDHRVLKKNFYYNDTKGFFCVRTETTDTCLDKTKGRKHPDVSPKVIKMLRKFYEPHNRQFFRQARSTLNWTTE